MREIWLELVNDLSSTTVYWELAVLAIGLGLAWMLNALIHQRVADRAPEAWQVGIGGIKRVLFPLSALVFVYFGKFLLRHWDHHTSLLTLATTLLVAMAVIRLSVYALRYIFAPSAFLKTTENAISAVIWFVVALHFSGLLPELVQGLEEAGFSIGKNRVSVLLILQSVVTVVVTVVVALWLSRLLENRLMGAEQIDMNLRVVMTKLVRILLTLVGVLVALSAVGFDITLLSVFGGALGVGLGFGLQKIASNYVSGFIILLDQSVHLNDVITVDNHYGVVHQIRSRYTVLRKLDGTEVVIPNDTLITSAVINHSLSDRKARVLIPVQVGYECNLEKVMDIMQRAASQHPRVLKDPAPEGQVLGFGESGIDLQLSLWIEDPEEGSGGLKSAIYLDIWREFKAHGVTVPYPQREIRIIGSQA
jgi:small-conductance mechanosensitive channel